VKILAYISTRGRYDVMLPLAINSIIVQTLRPNHLIIFDDNDQPVDLRTIPVYQHLFQMLTSKGIKWEVIFGQKKGQHFNHQMANQMKDYDWCWRMDDDCVAEPDVLEKLIHVAKTNDMVGAIGGSIIVPPMATGQGSNKITELYFPNKQWFEVKAPEEVDHLHCSFIYRPGIVNYDLDLSPVAHREETLFSYRLKLAGYHNYITPCITWHLKSPGGIRTHNHPEYYERDEDLFKKKIAALGTVLPDTFYVVLDNGIGDHFAFLNILPDLQEKHKNIVIACCYPEVFDGLGIQLISIAEANLILGDTTKYNLYKYLIDNNWNKSMPEAFRSMYL
jgi:glycosyltransferase involved in cell wall biosynthesis